jgi:hypothetical protein
MTTEPRTPTEPERHEDTPEERAEGIAKLRRAIELSGLSDRRFAKEVLVRDERTIRRWLAGDRPISKAVREKIDELLAGAPNAGKKRKATRRKE